MSTTSKKLGTAPVRKLLIQQSVPAMIGFMVMAVYMNVDVYFVSKYVGKLAIAGINIVLPITFLISSAGMAIGIGGSSIISRALGANETAKVRKTFGNQISLTMTISILFVFLGYVFMDPVLHIFGSNAETDPEAKIFFRTLLPGLPFLAWAMMSNSVIRAEGKPKIAMLTLVIPALSNIILDPVFIYYMDMGISGAAWATLIGYVGSGIYTLWFFLSGRSEITIVNEDFRLSRDLVKEIASLGSVTFVRQGSFSLLAIVLNNSLDAYGGSLALAIYGIIRGFTMMLAFPSIGLNQGALPIVGYNHGAEKYDRIKSTLKYAVLWSTVISAVFYVSLIFFASHIIGFYTDDPDLIRETPRAIIISFAGLTTMGVSFIAAGYFQAIGKVKPALFLTLARQGLFMIPLMLILPLFMGIDGVWISMPIGEILATIVSVIYLHRAIKKY